MAVYSEMKSKKRKRIKIHDDPYHKRKMLCKNRDPNSKEPFEVRIPTFRESLAYYSWEAFAWFIRTLIWPFQKIGIFLYAIFWPKSNFQFNGIIGPGGHTSYERHFSWGKLSFALVILFIIVYFIFLR